MCEDDKFYAVESGGSSSKANAVRITLASSMMAFLSGVGLVTILNVICSAVVSGVVLNSIYQNDEPRSYPDDKIELGQKSALVSSGFRDFIATERPHSNELSEGSLGQLNPPLNQQEKMENND